MCLIIQNFTHKFQNITFSFTNHISIHDTQHAIQNREQQHKFRPQKLSLLNKMKKKVQPLKVKVRTNTNN